MGDVGWQGRLMRSGVGVLSLLVVCLVLGLLFGSTPISLAQLEQVVRGTADPTTRTIVLELRLPRVVLAALVGGALALAGCGMQGLLKNPLADPYIVGTSAGAAFGAALASLLGITGTLGFWSRPGFAFVGALLTMLTVYAMAQRRGHLSVHLFLLSGVVVGSFLGAWVSFFLAMARGELLRDLVFWLMGDLSGADWLRIRLMLVYAVPSLCGLGLCAAPLNLMALGEDAAAALGVRVEALKLGVIACSALLTATAVSVSGLVGFVGLMVPHTARRLVGADHRVLLPIAAVLGACCLILADTLARSLLPGELPVGVVTAMVGGPFFFVILRRDLAR